MKNLCCFEATVEERWDDGKPSVQRTGAFHCDPNTPIAVAREMVRLFAAQLDEIERQTEERKKEMEEAAQKMAENNKSQEVIEDAEICSCF